MNKEHSMRILTAIVAVVLSVASASAGETVCLKVVSTVGCEQGSCRRSTSYGSCVVISEGKPGEWRAITAGHNLEGATVDNTFVAVDGAWRPIFQIYRVEDGGDSAFIAFRLNRDMRITPTAARDDEVEPGDQITFDGFANGDTYKKVAGTIVENGVAKCMARPIRGQSGGGVYNNGVLIGTVTGFDSNTGNLVYEPIGRVRQRCVQQWGFWVGICQPIPRQRQVASIPNTRVPEMAPPPPPERPAVAPAPVVPTQPAPAPAPVVPVQPVQPGVTRDDLKALTDAIANMQKDLTSIKATKIPVQVLTADGSVISQDTVNLGDPIKLRLVPKQK